MIRRLVALTAAATLPAALLVSSQPAAGRGEEPHGAPGIGDPYFPLDGNGGIDVLSYDIHDRYRFAERRLSGWTKVTLQASEALSGFDLDFLLPVKSVTVGGRAVEFHQGSAHELVVDHPVSGGQVVRMVVRYDGKPSKFGYAGEHNWLADAHEVVAMNQPHMAPWWFPANDHPLDRADMRISITVPKANRVIANGRLAKRKVDGGRATTTWVADEPMVPYLAFFAAGRFEVAKGTAHGYPWYSAVSRRLPAEDRDRAMALMKRTPELLHWVESQLGDYPFSTTGGVTTSLAPGFALENQTRPTYPANLSEPVVTVVHELAHQWFGDSVALAGWKDIWLNEGAATFMEARYVETHGGRSANAWLRDWYDDLPADDDFWTHRVSDPCPAHTGCVSSIFAWWVYQRGGMALQALRNRIGNDDYWQLLHRWVTDRAGGNGSTAEFEALAEEVSGQDLDPFFDAWIHTPEKPADTAANGLR